MKRYLWLAVLLAVALPASTQEDKTAATANTGGFANCAWWNGIPRTNDPSDPTLAIIYAAYIRGYTDGVWWGSLTATGNNTTASDAVFDRSMPGKLTVGELTNRVTKECSVPSNKQAPIAAVIAKIAAEMNAP